MHPAAFSPNRIACLAALLATIPCTATATTLCVANGAHPPCFSTISSAVAAASNYDVIRVAPGTYKDDVVIGRPLSLLGSDADTTIIDATGRSNGIFVDGLSHPGLHNVTIANFTVKNALYEGVLVVNTSDATIRDNRILNNDLIGPVFGSGQACKGQPAFETDESGDCGGGLHLMGVAHSIISGNLFTKNGDGVLISDDTGESHDNLLIDNSAIDNPPECGIVLASHPPMGSTGPHYAPHYGVDHNTVARNIASRNGVKVGGSGVGLFSDGNGPGRVSQNVVIENELTGNGIPGVALHSHVGPAFGAPPDNMDGNIIVDNFISGNGADTDDTATPGTTGININSGGGGSPVHHTIIAGNVITDEDVDIAVNTTTEVDAHLNNLLGDQIGVANVCAFDNATNLAICTGSINATENFWECGGKPGADGCTTTSGANIRFIPWLRSPVRDPNTPGQGNY